MASARSDNPGDNAATVPAFTAHKILIAGGFGAGKTTLVGAISEVRPLQTEEALTTASIGRDDLTGVGRKTTTTVALDFGRITLGARIVLYLFGMPGQERFAFMWDELAYGALGAVILADVRRLGDCFPSVNYFEKLRLPFVVAVNCFDNAPSYDPQEIRHALALDPGNPLVLCDARDVASVKSVLITLVETIASRRSARPGPGRGRTAPRSSRFGH